VGGHCGWVGGHSVRVQSSSSRKGKCKEGIGRTRRLDGIEYMGGRGRSNVAGTDAETQMKGTESEKRRKQTKIKKQKEDQGRRSREQMLTRMMDPTDRRKNRFFCKTQIQSAHNKKKKGELTDKPKEIHHIV
jgi:hypothetical protein